MPSQEQLDVIKLTMIKFNKNRKKTAHELGLSERTVQRARETYYSEPSLDVIQVPLKNNLGYVIMDYDQYANISVCLEIFLSNAYEEREGIIASSLNDGDDNLNCINSTIRYLKQLKDAQWYVDKAKFIFGNP